MKKNLITFLCFLFYSTLFSQLHWVTTQVDSSIRSVVYTDGPIVNNPFFWNKNKDWVGTFIMEKTGEKIEVEGDVLFLNERYKYFLNYTDTATFISKHKLNAIVGSTPDTIFSIEGQWLFLNNPFGTEQSDWIISNGAPEEGGGCDNFLTFFCLDSLNKRHEIVVPGDNCWSIEFVKYEEDVVNLIFWDRESESTSLIWLKVNLTNLEHKIQRFDYPYRVNGGFGTLNLEGNLLVSSCNFDQQGVTKYALQNHSFDTGLFESVLTETYFYGGIFIQDGVLYTDAEKQSKFATQLEKILPTDFVQPQSENLERRTSSYCLPYGLFIFNKSQISRYAK